MGLPTAEHLAAVAEQLPREAVFHTFEALAGLLRRACATPGRLVVQPEPLPPAGHTLLEGCGLGQSSGAWRLAEQAPPEPAELCLTVIDSVLRIGRICGLGPQAASSAMSSLMESKLTAQAESERLREENDDLSASCQELEQQLAEARDSNKANPDSDTSDCRDATAASGDGEWELPASSVRRAEGSAEAAELRAQLEQCHMQIEQLQQQLSAAQTEAKESLCREHSPEGQATHALHAELRTAKADVQASREEVAAARDKMDALTAELQATAEQASATRAEADDANTRADTLGAELQAAKQAAEESRVAVAAANARADTLDAELQAASAGPTEPGWADPRYVSLQLLRRFLGEWIAMRILKALATWQEQIPGKGVVENVKENIDETETAETRDGVIAKLQKARNASKDEAEAAKARAKVLSAELQTVKEEATASKAEAEAAGTRLDAVSAELQAAKQEAEESRVAVAAANARADTLDAELQAASAGPTEPGWADPRYVSLQLLRRFLGEWIAMRILKALATWQDQMADVLAAQMQIVRKGAAVSRSEFEPAEDGDSLNAELQTARAEAQASKERLDAANAQIDTLTAELRVAQAEALTNKDAAEAAIARASALEDELQTVRQEAAASKDAAGVANARANALDAELQTAKQEAAESNDAAAAANARAETLHAELRAATSGPVTPVSPKVHADISSSPKQGSPLISLKIRPEKIRRESEAERRERKTEEALEARREAAERREASLEPPVGDAPQEPLAQPDASHAEADSDQINTRDTEAQWRLIAHTSESSNNVPSTLSRAHDIYLKGLQPSTKTKLSPQRSLLAKHRERLAQAR